MHRRTLVLRRFGGMSFALGCFEDGDWVDHTVLRQRPGWPEPAEMTAVERSALDAVHTWFDCCQGQASLIAVVAHGVSDDARTASV